jgi:hypothetical protein
MGAGDARSWRAAAGWELRWSVVARARNHLNLLFDAPHLQGRIDLYVGFRYRSLCGRSARDAKTSFSWPSIIGMLPSAVLDSPGTASRNCFASKSEAEPDPGFLSAGAILARQLFATVPALCRALIAFGPRQKVGSFCGLRLLLSGEGARRIASRRVAADRGQKLLDPCHRHFVALVGECCRLDDTGVIPCGKN